MTLGCRLSATLADLSKRPSNPREKWWRRIAVACVVVLFVRELLPALTHRGLNLMERLVGLAMVTWSGRPAHCARRPYGALVLEGGGVKGVAYSGAAAALQRHGLLKPRRVHAFAGTSAGAMMASLMAAGADARLVVETLLEYPFETLMDGGGVAANLQRLQKNFGWFKGAIIEERTRDLLRSILRTTAMRATTVAKKKESNSTATTTKSTIEVLVSSALTNVSFADLTRLTGRRLRVSVTDVSAGRHAWLDERATPGVGVARAVRASSAVPFIYPPVTIDGRILVDGGLLRNLPSNAFDGDLFYDGPPRPSRFHFGPLASWWARKRPRRRRSTLALSIRPEQDPLADGDHDGLWRRNIWGFAGRLLTTVMWGNDSPNKFPEDEPYLDVVRIDTLNVSAADFSLDKRTRARLVANGYRAVANHLLLCGHVTTLKDPPEWLVLILRNFSNGDDLPLR